jgi:BirA family biotin operon repressor/biotin-[acetyl-CoA-carboxylase] ligase
MITIQDLREALAGVGLLTPVRWDDETGSTNDNAWAMAEAGTPEWTLVGTGHQTAGRGRDDRAWTDVPQGALLLSVVLRPSLPAARAGLIPLLAGAAMATAIRKETGDTAKCKWPNDLIVGERKVGGILSRSSIERGQLRYVIVGVGVNLQRPEGVEGAGAVHAADPPGLLARFIRVLHEGYKPDDPSFAGGVRMAWMTVAATIGKEVVVEQRDGDSLHGRAVDVDEMGRLVVSTTDGEVAVASGDVVHLR